MEAMNKALVLTAAVLMSLGASASADTLYVAPPASLAPGHPLHLGPDHRAQQVGDVINVTFVFSASNSLADTVTTTKGFNAGANQGANTPIKLFNIVNIPTSISGTSGSNYSSTHTITTSFQTSMMATVIDVLPSGALVIAGDQNLVVNGTGQKVHVTGVVRPEDIDNTDSVPSTRIANVQARYDANFQEKNSGLIQRVMQFLF
jgi:flagellar L-ring protein precursor FlgH